MEDSMGEILQIKDLQVSYGGIDAVRGISFNVKEGEIVTLIGANGAGKSSTLRAISGLVKAKGGSILFNGDEIRGMDPTAIVSKGLMMVPEGRKIFPNLTVLENLRIGAYLRKDQLDRHVKTLSTLTYIRHSIDTRDEFYDGEMNFWNAAGPELMEYDEQWTRVLLDSKFRNELEAEFGEVIFLNAELELKSFKPEIIPLLQKEEKQLLKGIFC